MGPTVWDEDGPTPMENRSNVDMTACSARADRPGSGSASCRAGVRDEEGLEERNVGWRDGVVGRGAKELNARREVLGNARVRWRRLCWDV
jgi:hypothetical protein